MNQLVSITSAEFLVFTDANVIFTPDTIPCLLRPFADPKVGCVSGRLTYIEPTRTASASMVSRYWRLDQKIKELESRTGSAIGAAGAIFAVRYHLHCSPPPDIIEDMYVSISILCDGHRVVFVEDAIGYEEMVSRPREEFGRKIRISCQAFNVHRLLRPRLRTLSALNRYKYVSHKLLRWITIYLLGMSALSIVAGLVLAGSWLLLAGLTMTSLLTFVAGRLQPRSAAAKLLAATDALVATGIGVCRSVRGERFQTWSSPGIRARSCSGVRVTAKRVRNFPERKRGFCSGRYYVIVTQRCGTDGYGRLDPLERSCYENWHCSGHRV